ncbi:1-acyl-sn-glycerol-3-phosphate acyltransferase [Waterburya agarophytonicola K14]|uniref:1-acyl-sn-glycerol-3-phosphate acyltransferase n=1 Tax=Waterburya agarophytonicola KI4 TaxID=2874699 RepID=A0A964BWR1_9CYAN|nr:1-acyl-sn-glycerol-3-phosphate acyltransferase [Waterburya agarophytonicola]MCC0179131.1 1-acyl-sn-glycerol-3-phosphate acyltransferase [Waterburya agarophytonicola KI4]
MTQAQPSLEFIPPAYNPLVWQAAKRILPLWLGYNHDIVDVKIDNSTELIRLYEEFQQGKTRFMLAFRHPAVTDPPCIAQLFWNQLPQIAKQQDVKLKSPVHLHFIYDRGIPLWAGDKVGWIISKLGSTPIRRGALDRVGLRSIRDLFVNGDFPMAAAPEGATNGHNEVVSPIEPGIAQFGFWCQEDLIKVGREEAVAIAPLGIRYFYKTAPWQYLEQLLSNLEVDSGFKQTPAETMGLTNGITLSPSQEADLYGRMYALAEYLLSLMEEFYSKFYQQKISTSEGELSSRLPALLDAALKVAEQSFAVKPNGNISDRCRRVEQAAWNRIYREDLDKLTELAPAVRGLADLVASEAELRLWHMRLVETFVSVTGHYVAEKYTVERLADTVLLLWKMVAKLKGESNIKPPYLGKKWVQLTAMPSLQIADYWEQYQNNRRQAVSDMTQDLQQSLEQSILE